MKYLIDFKDQATTEQISAWLDKNKISNPTVMSALDGVYIVDSNAAPSAEDFIESITMDENISNKLLGTVEVIPQSTNETGTFDHDADWWKTAAAYKVDFKEQTTTFEKRGAKTSVYVVDSGVDDTHPEFEGVNVVQLFSFNGDVEDTNGHGTAIASVVAGKTLGITTSTIKSVKIFDSSKTTMTSDIITAIDTILADILSNDGHISIVNMSWAISKDEYIESKIQELINAGAKVIVAAGNDGTPIQNVTPASMESVLTIGAFDDNFLPADFSNYTSDVKNTDGAVNYGALDCWAPGVNIGVAKLGGTNGIAAGTSIAAAIVSACMAYNSDMLYTDVGVTASLDYFLDIFTLRKKNLLTLADKYAGSENLCTCFITEALPTWYNGSYSASRMAFDNRDLHGFIASSAFVSKIELDGDLPDGLSLSKGWIVGRLTKAPEATQELNYLATITFTNGEVNTFNLKLFLAKAGTPPGEYPTDIELQVPGNYCQPNSNLTGCSNYTCESFCPNCDPKSGDCPCDQECR